MLPQDHKPSAHSQTPFSVHSLRTELRAAATLAVRQALTDASIIDPKKYMGKARDAVRALCLHKIDICGSAGKI